MFGGPSERQDHSSTSHWVRQLSTVFTAKNGTGWRVQKLCSRLDFPLILFTPWYSARLRGTVTCWSITASPGLHGIEIHITQHTFTSHPLLPQHPWVRRGPMSRGDTFKECIWDPLIFFSSAPEAWKPIISNDVATKSRPPGSLSPSLEESYLEELLAFSTLPKGKS